MVACILYDAGSVKNLNQNGGLCSVHCFKFLAKLPDFLFDHLWPIGDSLLLILLGPISMFSLLLSNIFLYFKLCSK